jgi:hypothetical protein
MKNLTKERIQQVKALEVGQRIKVDTDNRHFGRLISQGTILDLRGIKARLALVLVDAAGGHGLINILVPKRDIYWLELYD